MEYNYMKRYCSTMDGHDGKRYYSHIYPSVEQVKMCVGPQDEIYEVDIREAEGDEETPYWGWLDNDGDISMVFPRFELLAMCFPYGIKAAEENGDGQGVKVIVKQKEVTQTMGELQLIKIATLCPHCGSKNIETGSQWGDLDAHSCDKQDYGIQVQVQLDYEGEDYFLYFFKCRDCGASFCIKRLHMQTE